MISSKEIQSFLLAELGVDRASDDVTTRLLGGKSARSCRVIVVAKAPGVFCGKEVVEALQSLYPEEIRSLEIRDNGTNVLGGDTVLSFSSSVSRALILERTLLNIVTHLSGVASTTRKFVEAVKPYSTKILATRKTLPGMRDLQLLAVVAGGGFVHRRNLSDGILIKDNHVAIGGIENLLKRAEEIRSPLHRVEIEVQSLEQLEQVLTMGADVVMLDNFDLSMLREGIQRIRSKYEKSIKIEVSGGITLDSVRSIAELGVDYISVGMLTHSVTALNMSLDLALVL